MTSFALWDLYPAESEALQRMLTTIRARRTSNQLRSDYHDSKKRLDKIGFSVPPSMRDFQISIGWAEKAVTVPAARIRPDGFTSRIGGELVDEINDFAQAESFARKDRFAVRSALQFGCSFAFTTPGPGDPENLQDITQDNDPRVTVRSALDATAELDPRTGEVTAALEIVGTHEHVLYMPGYYIEITKSATDGKWYATRTRLGVEGLVTCTPYFWGATLQKPFGTSRISAPLMGFIDTGVRTMLRQETTAEFFAAPQRVLLGATPEHFTDEKGNRISPLRALMGGTWALPDTYDEDEDKVRRPELIQLPQASMTPHSDMMRSIAAMVSSETTIPLGYLGVVHDNPSSADAILASESDMVAMIEAELPSIGASRVDLARKIMAVKYRAQNTPLLLKELKNLRSYFADPGTPTRSQRADAALKFTTAFPAADPVVAMEMYGLSRDQIARNSEYMRKASAAQAVSSLADLLSNTGQAVNADG